MDNSKIISPTELYPKFKQYINEKVKCILSLLIFYLPGMKSYLATLCQQRQSKIDKWQILDKYSMVHNGHLTLSKYFRWACHKILKEEWITFYRNSNLRKLRVPRILQINCRYIASFSTIMMIRFLHNKRNNKIQNVRWWIG